MCEFVNYECANCGNNYGFDMCMGLCGIIDSPGTCKIVRDDVISDCSQCRPQDDDAQEDTTSSEVNMWALIRLTPQWILIPEFVLRLGSRGWKCRDINAEVFIAIISSIALRAQKKEESLPRMVSVPPTFPLYCHLALCYQCIWPPCLQTTIPSGGWDLYTVLHKIICTPGRNWSLVLFTKPQATSVPLLMQ